MKQKKNIFPVTAVIINFSAICLLLISAQPEGIQGLGNIVILYANVLLISSLACLFAPEKTLKEALKKEIPYLVKIPGEVWDFCKILLALISAYYGWWWCCFCFACAWIFIASWRKRRNDLRDAMEKSGELQPSA